MSKPVKAMLRRELIRRLEGVDALVVLSLAGVDGMAANRLRGSLREKNIHLTVVKNAVAKQALKEVGLAPASALLEGPCAFAIAGRPDPVGPMLIVRELLGQSQEIPALRVRGALMEGEVFGADRVAELSRYPTREEALGDLTVVALSAGSRLVAALLGPGGSIGGILKAVEDRGGEQPSAAAAVPA
jgi:large subunit ribosomal protein L10